MKSLPLKISFLLGLLAIALTIGCSTPNSTTTQYKTAVATDVGVKAALAGWNAYIPVGHPSTNDELKVLYLYKSVQQAELGVVAAEQSLAANTTNTAPYQAALTALLTAQANLISGITTLTNVIH